MSGKGIRKLRLLPKVQKVRPVLPATMADWAYEYACCGWPIYPVAVSGEPLVGAALRRTGSTDVAQVSAWWGEWPEANIALPTGEATGWMVAEAFSVEAQRTASMLMPPTGSKLRRPNGNVLYVYRSLSTGPLPTQRYIDPMTGEPMLILHGDDDAILLPPSLVTA